MRLRRFFALALLIAALSMARSIAAPEFSDWSAPKNLGPGINSSFDDYGAAVSKDGLTLYFTSNRPGGFGGEDIWVSQRSSKEDSWGPPVNLGPTVNSSFTEQTPALSRDEHELYFASNRFGGRGLLDVWSSHREFVHDDFNWEAPANLGPGVNSSSNDTGPSYFENEGGSPQLYFARFPAGGTADIYLSLRNADGSFASATNVAELNTPFQDAGPDIWHNGLQILLHSNRLGSAGTDLWIAERESTLDPWGPPVNLGSVVNSASTDRDGTISADGETLIFSSDRPGGFGGRDLYESTRSKRRKP